MNKILLIIKREYLTRVTKKSFIIMSILGPVLMGGLVAGFSYLAMNQGDAVSRIKVIDETKILADKLVSSENIIFEKDTLPLEISRQIFNGNEYYGILYLPSTTINDSKQCVLYTEKQPNLTVVSFIESKLQKEVEAYKLSLAGIQKSTLDSIKTRVELQQKAVTVSGKDKEFSAGATAVIGFGGGLLIYLFIFLYGVQVMRGVIEEKTNRIVEVIISSVKPFQLMMGKIVGIALVGLTQFMIWIVLTFAVTSVATALVTGNSNSMKTKMEQMNNMQPMQKTSGEEFKGKEEFNIGSVAGIFSSLNFTKIIISFIFYFLFGYLMYSALFAAIGAAVDSETDTQQFMLPITIPLIFAYVVSTIVMQNPESKLGYWFSLIPFTSPVVMMVRMPFDPPWIDIIISMILLIAGFIFTTWIAARIYRTGILMYGKKVTWKEMGKWLFYKE
ncbi:MAG TPA: ABC transporter permease [Bacteroidia bacterium]|nr:ABC transporter permease [Bacteroidia bacterium]HNU33096.1 ABC transporter permease [Bacteroidia bacterium]